MAFEIIKNALPLPPKSRERSRYPFAEMEVGDAFDVPVGDMTPTGAVNRVTSASSHFGKLHGRKFAARRIQNDDGASVIRCWRIA